MQVIHAALRKGAHTTEVKVPGPHAVQALQTVSFQAVQFSLAYVPPAQVLQRCSTYMLSRRLQKWPARHATHCSVLFW